MYAVSTIGPDLKTICQSTERPKFESFDEGVGLFTGIEIHTPFAVHSQDRHFSSLFGVLMEKYFSHSKYNRGHIFPNSGLAQYALRNVTNYDGNLRPSDVIINSAWALIEAYQRDLAARMRKDLETISGAHGQASLPDIDGKPVSLSLSGHMHVIPELFYVIVMIENEALVFFMRNYNPANWKHVQAKTPFCPSRKEQITSVPWDAIYHKLGGNRDMVDVCELPEFVKSLDHKPITVKPYEEYGLLIPPE